MIGTMNQRMARVFTLLGVGFLGVVVLLTWWQVVVAGELRQKDSNNQTRYYEQRVQRGFITSRDGVRLAGRASRTGPNGDLIWSRRYPQGSLAAHVVGYDTRGRSRTGVEQAMNDVLTGSTRDLGAVVGLLDGDETAIGDDVQLTIHAGAQRIAERALAERGRGAVVAVNPQTGKVLVMASSPSFDPGDVENEFEGIVARGGSPLLNRATQGAYAPGSTFKLVTAAAALEGGVDADRRFPGGCEYDAQSGPPVGNFGGDCAPAHDFTTALTNSINVTFAELGDELGAAALREQMRAFGFYDTPPIEGLPANELRASGLYDENRKLLGDEAPMDAARVAIGQEKLAVTPLQMAMVVAAIANDGVLLEPTLVEKVTSPTGRVSERAEPEVWERAMSPATARTLRRMMENVVREGTGTAAALEGIDVGGKTGTADTASGNQVWFVGYAPAGNPQVAIAVTVEGLSSGQTGGVVAAPIARDVMQALLRGGAADGAGAR